MFDIVRIELDIRSQAKCLNRLEVLKWFTEDNTEMLYELIMDNKGINDFMYEVSNRVLLHDGFYYILEEEDMLYIIALKESL